MVSDPAAGMILAILEMHEPENKTVALDSLRSVTATYPKINCVIYDRMCSLLPSASRRKDLAQAGEVLVCGHVPRQTPLFQVRLLPVQRLKNVNTSVSEQIFAWFGGYATTLIHLSNVRRRLYVPACAKRHNLILMQADAAHLSPFSAHEKAMRKGEARSVAAPSLSTRDQARSEPCMMDGLGACWQGVVWFKVQTFQLDGVFSTQLLSLFLP